MKPDTLRAWMKANRLTIRQTASALQVSPTSIQKWLKAGAPHYIGLAVAALAHGLEPFIG
jgi:transcriptional regulator with XRE-family HTH domain